MRYLTFGMILLLAGSSVLVVFGAENTKAIDNRKSEGNSSNFTRHKLTREEMIKWKESCGVGRPGKEKANNTGYMPPTEEQYESLVGNLTVVESSTGSSTPTVSSTSTTTLSLPSSVDLTDDEHFPPVRAQGDHPTCCSFAAGYYALTYEIADEYGWEASNTEHQMSPKWIYNKVNYGWENKTTMPSNLKIATDLGCASWDEMPYDKSDFDYVSWGDESAWRDAQQHQAQGPNPETGVEGYEVTPITDTDTIKTWINNGSPSTFGLAATELNDLSPSDPVLSSEEYTSLAQNHAQTIVGYDDSKSDDGETGAFKIVNSRGPNWGPNNDGTYWMTYECFKNFPYSDAKVYHYKGTEYNSPDGSSKIATWEFSVQEDRNHDWSISQGSNTVKGRLGTMHYDETWEVVIGEPRTYPSFMCLDISDLATEGTYSLRAGREVDEVPTDKSEVSSFQVEQYVTYDPDGNPDDTSSGTTNIPCWTPISLSDNVETTYDDTADPWVNIYYPEDGSYVDGGKITVKWNGGDDETGIDYYKAKVDDGNWENVGTQESFTYTFVGGFWYDITVKAYDNGGNSQTDTVTFYAEEDGGPLAPSG